MSDYQIVPNYNPHLYALEISVTPDDIDIAMVPIVGWEIDRGFCSGKITPPIENEGHVFHYYESDPTTGHLYENGPLYDRQTDTVFPRDYMVDRKDATLEAHKKRLRREYNNAAKSKAAA